MGHIFSPYTQGTWMYPGSSVRLTYLAPSVMLEAMLVMLQHGWAEPAASVVYSETPGDDPLSPDCVW